MWVCVLDMESVSGFLGFSFQFAVSFWSLILVISSRVTKCRNLCLILWQERMAEGLKQSGNPWMDTDEVSSRAAEFNKDVSLMSESVSIVDGLEAPKASENRSHRLDVSSGGQLGFTERALSAAGAAFLSAILVNPLDVVKVYI